MSSTDLKSWTAHTIPTSGCGLTTYHSHLVLVGGWETTTGKVTEKIWESDSGLDWRAMLPEMSTARGFPFALSTGGAEEYLLVACGCGVDYKEVSTVDILVNGQWFTVQTVPRQRQIYKCTLHDCRLFVDTRVAVYQCDLKSAILSHTHQGNGNEPSSYPPWSELALPVPNLTLASLGQQLIAIGGESIYVHQAMGGDQSWVCVGCSPEGGVMGLVILSTGHLVVITRGHNATGVFAMKLKGKDVQK